MLIVELRVHPTGYFLASASSLGTTDAKVRASLLRAGVDSRFLAGLRHLKLEGRVPRGPIGDIALVAQEAARRLRTLEPQGEC